MGETSPRLCTSLFLLLRKATQFGITKTNKLQCTLYRTEPNGNKTNRVLSYRRMLEEALTNRMQQNAVPDGFPT